MGTGAITWSSKKQHIVALSSTEAEYVAQTHAAKEAMYLRTLVEEICGFDKPVTLNCDNQGAIALSKDNKFHTRTKHIDIRCHFIREAVTKPLPKAKFRRFVEWDLSRPFDTN